MSETFYRLLFIFIDVILPITIGYYLHKYSIISLNTCNFLLKLNIRFIMIITGLGSFWLIKIDQNLFLLAFVGIILFRHLVPSIAADLAVLSSLDVGWAIINISTLSFLGLGVQAPTPEWGAMLSEAKNVLTSNPAQMLVPGIAIVILVSAFNLMGDAIRDVLDPKEVL